MARKSWRQLSHHVSTVRGTEEVVLSLPVVGLPQNEGPREAVSPPLRGAGGRVLQQGTRLGMGIRAPAGLWCRRLLTATSK